MERPTSAERISVDRIVNREHVPDLSRDVRPPRLPAGRIIVASLSLSLFVLSADPRITLFCFNPSADLPTPVRSLLLRKRAGRLKF